ncbi:MAG: hypothetical protein J6D23_01445 [Clostridia bacterium]|nr:hypothetical protein [Clostridia bacterium]
MKRIISILLLIVFAMMLFGCNTGDTGGEDSTTSSSEQTTPSSKPNDTTESSGKEESPDTDKPGEEVSEFSVYLMYNGLPFAGDTESPIKVKWTDGISFISAPVNENGIAVMYGLDGDYRVTLDNIPDGYTYNPNIYEATNDKPNVRIDIYKIGTTKGAGSGLYSRKELSATSMYRATLKNAQQKLYFEFRPTKSGTYTIESWVSTSDDKINPKIDVYTSSFAAPIYLYTLDTGGTEGENYTKNFKYEVEIADEMISTSGGGQVVFVFSIYATARNEKYFPLNVDFAVQYEGGFELEHTSSDYVIPNELYDIMADKLLEMRALSKEDFLNEYSFATEESYNELQALTGAQLSDGLALNIFLNKHEFIRGQCVQHLKSYFNRIYGADVGKTWVNPATTINGRVVLIGDNYRYNEKTGFYHRYDETKYTDDSEDGFGFGYGPIIYADITVSARTKVLDRSFTTVEYQGNKALTVSNGTENYKFFIESYDSAQSMSMSVYGGMIECSEDYIGLIGYASIINSDGAVPVTKELKDFLQKYSVNQVLFMDGDGWAETGNPPYESTEDDQWLFACGYYE